MRSWRSNLNRLQEATAGPRNVQRLIAPDGRASCQSVRPATIRAWFRQLAAQEYDSSKGRRPGHPLKIEIGRTTVADMLAAVGIEPAPERYRERTWSHFLKSHWETLYACDFFSVEVLGVFGTVRYMVFFVIDVKTRAMRIAGIRIAQDGAWMRQMVRNLLDPVDGFLRNASYLSHDRHPLFTRARTVLLTTRCWVRLNAGHVAADCSASTIGKRREGQRRVSGQ